MARKSVDCAIAPDRQSGNLSELEGEINKQAAKGYRLHTITTASAKSSGFGGGDRIQATMVFEKLS
jgi:hypothetical protein